MAAVGLVYAPLAPLVALAAAVVFWISSVVYKYQLMFVFVSTVESGGVGQPHQGFKSTY
jgi:calcium permeable stress-gated cation channel